MNNKNADLALKCLTAVLPIFAFLLIRDGMPLAAGGNFLSVAVGTFATLWGVHCLLAGMFMSALILSQPDERRTRSAM